MTETDWIDGPKLVAWLGDDVNGLERKRPAFARNLSRWRCGRAANVYTVDAVLVAIGRHLSEIPDDFYVPRPLRQVFSEDVKDEVRRRIRAGERPIDIGREVGVCDKTIHNWMAA